MEALRQYMNLFGETHPHVAKVPAASSSPSPVIPLTHIYIYTLTRIHTGVEQPRNSHG
jgi:hypothetical protein